MQSHDRTVELFRIRTEDEVRKKQARRRKRMKEKKEQGRAKAKDGKRDQEHEPEADDNAMDVDEPAAQLVDLFTPYLVVRGSGKIRSFDFGDEEASGKGATQVFLALSSNALEVYNVPPPAKTKDVLPETTRIFSVDLPGHRTDVRTLCLSSDDTLLASGSSGKLLLRAPSQYFAHPQNDFRLSQNLEYEDYGLHTNAGMWTRDLQHLLARRPSGSACQHVVIEIY